jgi:sulfite reductase (ferredoxin)
MLHSAWFTDWKKAQTTTYQRVAREYEDLFRLFMHGDLDEQKFRKRRAHFGAGPRPVAGRVLLRLTIPLGRLSPEQLRAAADLAERFTPGRHFHLTPRQNLHFYDVPLEDSPVFMHEAADAGFGLAPAAGDGPCNVILPAGCGVLPGEAFDPSFAAALLQQRLSHDTALRDLPGPFKVGFWRSLYDEESEPGNDLTVVPVRRRVGTRQMRGFRLLLGGGLGPNPRVEALWKSFVLPEELYAHVRAVALHFKDRCQDSRPGMRLRDLLQAEGWPAFQEDVAQRAAEQDLDRKALFFHRLPLGLPLGTAAALPSWLHGFAVPLPEQGTFLVKGQPLGGMLDVATALDLASLIERYGQGELRVTPRQQLWIPGIGEPNLLAAFQELQRLGLAGSFLGSFCACPGRGLCPRATQDTLALGQMVLDALKEGLGSDLGRATAGLRLGASACGNGCGRHRSADLGLEACMVERNGRREALVRVYGHSPARPYLGESVGNLAQEKVPFLVRTLVDAYKRSQAPDLAAFLRLPEGYSVLRNTVSSCESKMS